MFRQTLRELLRVAPPIEIYHENPFNDNTTNSIFFPPPPSPLPSLHKLSSQLNFALKSHYPVPSCDHRFLFLLHCFPKAQIFELTNNLPAVALPPTSEL